MLILSNDYYTELLKYPPKLAYKRPFSEAFRWNRRGHFKRGRK